MTPSFLTVAEVAEALRVSPMTVYRLTETREIASTRIGRSIRIHDGALNAYLVRNTHPAVAIRHPLRSTG